MKPLKYKEIMPRVAIEKLKLIEKEELIDLIGKNLDGIRCALLDTSYREDILKIPEKEVNSTSMEEALLENYAQTLKNLIKFSSGDVKNVLSAVAGKIETINIKTLFRALKAKMNVDQAIRHIIPVGNLNKDQCRDILSASVTIEDIIESLADSEYASIMKKVFFENKTSDSLLPLELSLEKAAYQTIFKSIEKLKGKDKLIAKNVFGIETDVINVKIILRYKAKGAPKDQIKKYFMPSFLINELTLERAVETTDVKTLIECLLEASEIVNNPLYTNIFIQILKQWKSPLSHLENILERASFRMSLDIQKKYPKYYNISYVLIFLNLKWLEVRNLRCLIVGSEKKIGTDKIKSLLIL